MITIRQFAKKYGLSEDAVRGSVRTHGAESLKTKGGIKYYHEQALMKLARKDGLMLDLERFLFLFKSNTVVDALSMCGAKRAALDREVKNNKGFADRYAEIKTEKAKAKLALVDKSQLLPEFPNDAQMIVDGLACKIGVHGKVFCWVNGAWILSSKTIAEFKNGVSIKTALATGEVK